MRNRRLECLPVDRIAHFPWVLPVLIAALLIVLTKEDLCDRKLSDRVFLEYSRAELAERALRFQIVKL